MSCRVGCVRTLIDDVINAMNEISYGSIESVEQVMHSVAPEVLGFRCAPGTVRADDSAGHVPVLTDAEEAEFQNGFHKLTTLLENSIDRNFDRFELFVLRNILVVREDLVGWVRLEHHKVRSPSCSPQLPVASIAPSSFNSSQ